MVEVTMTGKKELRELVLKPEVVDPEDIEMLQDLIVAAVNEAIRTVEAVSYTHLDVYKRQAQRRPRGVRPPDEAGRRRDRAARGARGVGQNPQRTFHRNDHRDQQTGYQETFLNFFVLPLCHHKFDSQTDYV